MKLSSILLTGILVLTTAVTPVFAESSVPEAPAETEEGTSEGVLDILFGEGGPLEGTLPEGTDINEMKEEAQKELERARSESEEIFNNFVEEIKKETEGMDAETAKDFAKNLLEQLSGNGQALSLDEIDELVKTTDSIRKAEEQYILEHNEGLYDYADVQIVGNTSLYEDDFDREEIRIIASMIQGNYKENDEGQLLFVSGGSDIVMFTHKKDENGNYPVIDAVFAEDGEKYMPSIEAMCEEVGIPAEEVLDTIEFEEKSFPFDLREYLNAHPEYKGIEYDGEIRTAEEFDELWNALIDEMYGAPEEELTEDDSAAAEDSEAAG